MRHSPHVVLTVAVGMLVGVLGCASNEKKLLGIWGSRNAKFHAYEFKPKGVLVEYWFERSDFPRQDDPEDKATKPGLGKWRVEQGGFYKVEGDQLTLYRYDSIFGKQTGQFKVVSLSSNKLVIKDSIEENTWSKIKKLPETTLQPTEYEE